MAGGTAIRRVLAAVDLSPMGRRVADRARLIAEEHGAELTLVHAVDPAEGAFLSNTERQAIRDATVKVASDLLKWIRSRTDGTVDLVVPRGNPARVVARLARDADLLVTGTSTIDATRVGPVTRRLARKTRVAVVAVRRQPRVPYRRVVAAVDLSEGSRQAVELARSIAPTAQITATFSLVARFDQVLAASGMPDDQIAFLRERRLEQAETALEQFASLWDDVKPLVVSGPPSTALGEAVRRRSADLVTVASKGGGGDSMVLLGGVAEEVLESAPCDVAIARVDSVFRRP